MPKGKVNSVNKPKKTKLSDLAKKYNKYAGSVTEEQFETNDYIDTGCYLLNAQISGSLFDGLPVGRSLLLAGKKGTGKTLIALGIAREAQKKYNSDILWIDTEGAVDRKTMSGLGIDVSGETSEVVIYPPETIQELTTMVVNTLDSYEGNNPSEVIIVVDSVSMSTTIAENDNVKQGNDKRDLSYQRELKKLFKTSLNRSRFKKISMIFVSHVYDNIGGYGADYKITGGESHQYAASTTLVFSKAQLKKEDDPMYDPSMEDDFENVKQTGVIITSNPDKSRFTKALPIKLQVSWSGGLNRYYGLKDFLRDDDLDNPNIGVGPGRYSGKVGDRVFKEQKVKGATYWGIKRLEKSVSNKKFYQASKYIFTPEVLEYLNNERIKPLFEFGKLITEPITLDELEEGGLDTDDNVNE